MRQFKALFYFLAYMIPNQPCTTSDTVAKEIQHRSPRRIGLIPLRTNCPK